MKYRENDLIFEQYRKVLNEGMGSVQRYEFQVDEIPEVPFDFGPYYVVGSVEYSTEDDIGGSGEPMRVPNWESGTIEKVYYFDEDDDDPQEIDITDQLTSEAEQYLIGELKDQFESDEHLGYSV